MLTCKVGFLWTVSPSSKKEKNSPSLKTVVCNHISNNWLHTTKFGRLKKSKITSNFIVFCHWKPSVPLSSGHTVTLFNIFSQISQLLLGFRRLVHLIDDNDIAPLDDIYYSEQSDTERNVHVLVIGATGKAGNVITKKLLLRDYSVRVLVRNLYSQTLDSVGTGCSFAKGDVRELSSLYDAVEGIDKVIWAAAASSPDQTHQVEYIGLQNVLKAFHDAKFQRHGNEESKTTLFKFEKPSDFERWKPARDDFRSRLAAVGLQKRPPKIDFIQNSRKNAVFTGKIFDAEVGSAEISCLSGHYDLDEFEGLIIRCIGDGKTYGFGLRTRAGDKAQVEYLARFRTIPNKWLTIRLPFAKFIMVPKEGILKPVSSQIELNPKDIYQMAISHVKTINNANDDGFYLAIDYIKAYRKQQEPEFIMISCSDVSKYISTRKLKELSEQDAITWKLRGEIALRNSGLTYCIIRSGKYNDQPGGLRHIVVDQKQVHDEKFISPADLADIVLRALTNSHACNVTFNAYESSQIPSLREEKVGALIEQLKANT
eukprot:jgi/Galph1/3935/GphlegSOOS_G2596.1